MASHEECELDGQRWLWRPEWWFQAEHRLKTRHWQIRDVLLKINIDVPYFIKTKTGIYCV